MLVTLVLLEVLDEAASQILGLLLPLGSVGVGIAGIQDAGVNTVQNFLVGTLLISPFRIASMIPRVSLMEMRLPVPFQPVLTR